MAKSRRAAKADSDQASTTTSPSEGESDRLWIELSNLGSSLRYARLALRMANEEVGEMDLSDLDARERVHVLLKSLELSLNDADDELEGAQDAIKRQWQEPDARA